MSNRSPAISLALLFAPTLCLVAIRFGLPAIEEVISEDIVLQVSIHAIALVSGAFMVFRYSRVEDHEFHRSRAIKRLSKTYRSEDKGLWDEKSDRALEKLEAKASSSNKRISSKVNVRMSGRIGSLNTEMNESEVEEDYKADVRVSGLQTIVDEENLNVSKEKASGFSISKTINSILDNSARKRLEKRNTREEKARLRVSKKSKKSKSKATNEDSLWNTNIPSKNSRTVVSCNQCGTLNNGGSQYCTSCGNYLIE